MLTRPAGYIPAVARASTLPAQCAPATGVRFLSPTDQPVYYS